MASSLALAGMTPNSSQSRTKGPNRGLLLIRCASSGEERLKAHSATKRKGVVGTTGKITPIMPAPTLAQPRASKAGRAKLAKTMVILSVLLKRDSSCNQPGDMASPEPSTPIETVDIGPKPHGSFFSRLRAYFFTGLVITAPIAITIWATYWFVTFFDAWVKPLIPTVYNPDTYLPFKVPGYGLIFALVAITLIGALAANLVGRTLIGWWDKLLDRTPVVRSIYKGSKQIFETIFSQKGASFRNVCLVEWPRKGAWSLAFVSREIDGSDVGLDAGRKMYAIYVSTTPNPTGVEWASSGIGGIRLSSAETAQIGRPCCLRWAVF